MPTVDSRLEELLNAQAARPAVPVERLTAAAVREDDLAMLALQRMPGPLYAIETVTPMLDATASSPSYLDFATGYGFTRAMAWFDRPAASSNRDTLGRDRSEC
jgi:hypothetical protein